MSKRPPFSAPLTKEQRLWQAATEGDLDQVAQLCADPAIDVNWKDPELGRTAFYRACGHGRTSVVQHLLRVRGLDLNLPQDEGATPFCIACSTGHMEVIILLMGDPRVDLHQAMKTGQTPFSVACLDGHLDVVLHLLKDRRIDPVEPDRDGITPLITACMNGYREVAAALLRDPRFDPNLASNDRRTPMTAACQNGHSSVVELLLGDPRIDPNRRKNYETTPIWIVAQEGYLTVAQQLLGSDFEIDITTKSEWNFKTPAEQGRAMGVKVRQEDEEERVFTRRRTLGPQVASLIEEYAQDRVSTRHRLRQLPQVRDPYIGRTLALVVFFADGFLRPQASPRHNTTTAATASATAAALRFFGISSLLPLELQMVLCNRLYGSGKNLVLSKHLEPGFRWVARASARATRL